MKCTAEGIESVFISISLSHNSGRFIATRICLSSNHMRRSV